MSDRLDLAELALTMAVIDREPWAIKYMLSTQGQKRGYVENTSPANDEFLKQLSEILSD